MVVWSANCSDFGECPGLTNSSVSEEYVFWLSPVLVCSSNPKLSLKEGREFEKLIDLFSGPWVARTGHSLYSVRSADPMSHLLLNVHFDVRPFMTIAMINSFRSLSFITELPFAFATLYSSNASNSSTNLSDTVL